MLCEVKDILVVSRGDVAVLLAETGNAIIVNKKYVK